VGRPRKTEAHTPGHGATTTSPQDGVKRGVGRPRMSGENATTTTNKTARRTTVPYTTNNGTTGVTFDFTNGTVERSEGYDTRSSPDKLRTRTPFVGHTANGRNDELARRGLGRPRETPHHTADGKSDTAPVRGGTSKSSHTAGRPKNSSKHSHNQTPGRPHTAPRTRSSYFIDSNTVYKALAAHTLGVLEGVAKGIDYRDIIQGWVQFRNAPPQGANNIAKFKPRDLRLQFYSKSLEYHAWLRWKVPNGLIPSS
jgi:hypothetical protein